MRYRLDLRNRAEKDIGFRKAMLAACKHDVLFFMNGFAWLFEPRIRFGSDGRQLPKTIPCITWPHQDPVILAIDKNLGLKDIGVEKSRSEGMSWLALLFAVRDWLFDPGAKVGIVSNIEKKADDPGNMDSLGAKIDWELKKLPKWMVPPYKRNLADHSWVNEQNFSQINAFAATSDAGRGGRYKWFLADELAFWDRPQDSKFMTSIRGATESRLVISTPNGTEGEYYSFIHTPSNIERLRLDWKDNPTRNRGLYKFKDGKPAAIDPLNNPLPKEYDPPDQNTLDLFSQLRTKGFKLEDKIRSPWYDNECFRADSTPQSVAQEFDMDYGGSKYRVFGNDFMEEAKKSTRPPMKQGMLGYHPETLAPLFDADDNGPLLLWCQLDHRGKPPARQYALAADVSSGLGGSHTSNSVVSIIDMSNLEQVGEYACNTMQPEDFADLCMSLGKWFYDAYLAWEANGPGSGFGKRVLDKGYGNIYYRTQHWKRGKARKTREAGWWTDSRSKESMFGEMIRAIRAGEVKPRSTRMIEECGQYIRLNGKIEHDLAINTEDDSSKGQAHGDRVIAFAIALQAVRDRPLASVALANSLAENPPPYTMAARQKEYDDAQKAKDGDGWDDRTNDDLAGGDVMIRSRSTGYARSDVW